MGRSQESFSKKEKEKKRLKKRKDKLQRKEERKANADNARSFEDMIGYVDEEGNITSSPPDPGKKSSIKAEDIEVSVSKKAQPDPSELIRKGTFSFFNHAKGYGFIKDQETRESIFVHVNNLEQPFDEGDKVTFEIEMGQRGPNAVNVKPLE